MMGTSMGRWLGVGALLIWLAVPDFASAHTGVGGGFVSGRDEPGGIEPFGSACGCSI